MFLLKFIDIFVVERRVPISSTSVITGKNHEVILLAAKESENFRLQFYCFHEGRPNERYVTSPGSETKMRQEEKPKIV